MLNLFRATMTLLPFIKEVFFQSSADTKHKWSRTVIVSMIAMGIALHFYSGFTERIDFLEKENLSYRQRIEDLEHQNIVLDSKYTSLDIAFRERGTTIITLNKTNAKLQLDLEEARAHHHETLIKLPTAAPSVVNTSSSPHISKPKPKPKPKPKVEPKPVVKPIPTPPKPAIVPRPAPPPPPVKREKNRLADLQ